MLNEEKQVSVSGTIILVLVFINAFILKIAFIENESLYIALVITLPLLFIAIYDVQQKRHALLRNYPVIGRIRYFFESIRIELRQYFFETHLDGKPFNPVDSLSKSEK